LCDSLRELGPPVGLQKRKCVRNDVFQQQKAVLLALNESVSTKNLKASGLRLKMMF